MAIDYEKLINWKFPELVRHYTVKDTILYALGIGLGADPVDRRQLQFTYEEGLVPFPTLPVVIGHPGPWYKDPDAGIDWVKVLHGEQSLVLHRPLPSEGTVLGSARVSSVVDKGANKGALVETQRELRDQATGELYATIGSTIFCRGDGGFGKPRSSKGAPPHPIPNRDPDIECDFSTLPQSALIYRLSGDLNPLHADPAIAAKAGFERPILHGLCTFGVAAHAILKSCCDYDAQALKSIQVRFSATVYPGETIRTEMWQDGHLVAFRARCVERGAVVLNNGQAVLRR